MSELLDGVVRARRRVEADRPSPAIPLALLALVVTGALVVAVTRAGQSVDTSVGGSGEFVLMKSVPSNDPVRLAYWVIASIVAYVLVLWVARRQGYRHGVWVDRLPLALGGLGALVVAAIVAVGWYAPGDLLIRGNVPLLAIAVGVIVWAARERRVGLWVVAAVVVVVTLAANLYNVENLLFRLGMPVFDTADEVVNLGVVAVALFAAAGLYGLWHRRTAQTRRVGSAS